jgi:hypothetical protein
LEKKNWCKYIGLKKPAIEHTRMPVHRDPAIVRHPALSGKCPPEIGNNPVSDPSATGTRIAIFAKYGSRRSLICLFNRLNPQAAKHQGMLLRRVEAQVQINGEERPMAFITDNLSGSPHWVCDLYRWRWDGPSPAQTTASTT